MKKARYPVEAFAFSIIVFSKSMKEAVLIGILLVLTTAFAEVLNRCLRNFIQDIYRILSVVIGVLSIYFALNQLVFQRIVPMKQEQYWMVYSMIAAILILKHILYNDIKCLVIRLKENDYEEEEQVYYSVDAAVYECAVAFGAFLIVALIREFVAVGSIFDYPLFKAGFMTKNIQVTAVGFLLAGIAIAAINKIVKAEQELLTGLFIIIPCIILFSPLQLKGVSIVVDKILGIAASILFFYGVKGRLLFTDTLKSFKHVPIELIAMGLIFLVLRGVG